MVIGNIVRMCRNSGNKERILTSIVDIMTSILPEDAQGEIPVGFSIVGHIGMAPAPQTADETDLC